MAQPAKSAAAQIYQIKVTLRGLRPPIWRRIQVPDNFTLAKLHRIIQVVMGWDDDHLHVFTWEGLNYGDPDLELGFRSEARVRLSQLHLEQKSRIRYEYDFGDSWEHDLLVEKILPPEPGVTYPALPGRKTGLSAGRRWRHLGLCKFPRCHTGPRPSISPGVPGVDRRRVRSRSV